MSFNTIADVLNNDTNIFNTRYETTLSKKSKISTHSFDCYEQREEEFTVLFKLKEKISEEYKNQMSKVLDCDTQAIDDFCHNIARQMFYQMVITELKERNIMLYSCIYDKSKRFYSQYQNNEISYYDCCELLKERFLKVDKLVLFAVLYQLV